VKEKQRRARACLGDVQPNPVDLDVPMLNARDRGDLR
jgi:hypothetical protein